jgi:hypothetical protein
MGVGGRGEYERFRFSKALQQSSFIGIPTLAALFCYSLSATIQNNSQERLLPFSSIVTAEPRPFVILTNAIVLIH